METTPQISARPRRVGPALVIAAAASLAGLLGTAVAVAAQSPASSDIGRIDRSVDSAGVGHPVDESEVDRQPTDFRLEPLRLACKVRQTDEQSGIACEWSAPASDRAVGVRLLRIQVGAGTGRQVVYRSSNLEVTEFVDVPVRPGHRYVYAVQALNHHGRVVGSSRPVVVAVPPVEPPMIDILRLNCGQASVDAASDRLHIGCEWSIPEAGAASELTLWRSVDGAARERVVSFTQPFETTYRDVVPAATKKVVYSVLVTNSYGEIVAQSRPETVIIRKVDVPERDVVKTDVPKTDVPRTDVPRTDVPRTDVPRTDVPRTDVPRTDVQRTDVPKTDVPAASVVDTTADERPVVTSPADDRDERKDDDGRDEIDRPTDTRVTAPTREDRGD